mmetsp:Transcript_7881/g.25980  ORF Transcript_7881/g.25980 Transcript_7881/m.25980 type:complete len:252 (+) Transcript_7881:51-806(+)
MRCDTHSVLHWSERTPCYIKPVLPGIRPGAPPRHSPLPARGAREAPHSHSASSSSGLSVGVLFLKSPPLSGDAMIGTSSEDAPEPPLLSPCASDGIASTCEPSRQTTSIAEAVAYTACSGTYPAPSRTAMTSPLSSTRKTAMVDARCESSSSPARTSAMAGQYSPSRHSKAEKASSSASYELETTGTSRQSAEPANTPPRQLVGETPYASSSAKPCAPAILLTMKMEKMSPCEIWCAARRSSEGVHMKTKA